MATKACTRSRVGIFPPCPGATFILPHRDAIMPKTTAEQQEATMSALPAGITPAGTGKADRSEDVTWNILGHTYWLKAQSEECFAFETLDPPGTLSLIHISEPTRLLSISYAVFCL